MDFNAQTNAYKKIALLPFKCAVDMAGQSVPDMLTTELFKTAKYELIERGQIESVLKEQEFRLQGVIDEAAAVTLGRVLGVQGVVIGTISEYGLQKRGISAVPSVGMSIRMIDTTTGRIVWSVSHSLAGESGETLSQAAQRAAAEMVMALSRAWIDMGDRTAPGLPPPHSVDARGGVREAVLEWEAHASKQIAGYEIQRRDPGASSFLPIKRLARQAGRMRFADPKLLDLTQYDYRLYTISPFGLISASWVSCEAITLGPPERPEGLSATDGLFRAVELSWPAPPDPSVTGYIVKRREAVGFKEIVRLWGINATRHVDGGDRRVPLEDGKTYRYVVAAFNQAGVESEPSEEVEGTTQPPPAAVRELRARGGLARAVALSWAPSPEKELVDGYKILRAGTPEGPFETVFRTRGRQVAEYSDGPRPGLKDNATYYYRVVAFNARQGDGLPSDTVSAVTRAPPPTPVGVQTSEGRPRTVDVQWERVEQGGVVKYRVYRAAVEQGRFSLVGEVPATTVRLQDRNLPDGQLFRYRVTALDDDLLESEPSETVRGSTKAAPSTPAHVHVATGGTGVEVSWTHDSPDTVAKYVIYQASSRRRLKMAETTETRHVLTIAPGRRMSLVVTAIDRDGLESGPSEAAPLAGRTR